MTDTYLLTPVAQELELRNLSSDSKWIMSGFDCAYAQWEPPVYFFRIDEILDADELKNGLQCVVNECPILATRLQVDKLPFTFGHFQGVQFKVVTVDDESIQLPDHRSLMEDWEKMGIVELLKPAKEVPILELSMMNAGMVRFLKQNVTILGIFRQHVVGDGYACCRIFHRWSYLSAKNAGKLASLNAKNLEIGKEPLQNTRLLFTQTLGTSLPCKDIDLSLLSTGRIHKYFSGSDNLALLKYELEMKRFGGSSQKPDLPWLEFRVPVTHIKYLKCTLLESLQVLQQTHVWENEVTWLSTFECVAAIMLASKLRANFNNETIVKLLPLCSFIVNTRSRFKDLADVANTDIGPAAYMMLGKYFSAEFLATARKLDGSVAFIALCAWYFHQSLQDELANSQAIAEELAVVQHLPNHTARASNGDMEKTRFVKIDISACAKREEMASLNSWATFDWLDVNFGSNQPRVHSMSRSRPGFPNYWFQYQACSHEIAAVMSFKTQNECELVKKEMKNLIDVSNLLIFC